MATHGSSPPPVKDASSGEAGGETVRKQLAVVGIGNRLAGDDGLGIEVVERLQRRWAGAENVLLTTLEGDLLAISDLLDQANRFIFVDAVAGDQVGAVVKHGETVRAYAPSFHQIDVASVMTSFKRLALVDPFPTWELWGVVIDPPFELRRGLSPTIACAAAELTEELSRTIASVVEDGSRPIESEE